MSMSLSGLIDGWMCEVTEIHCPECGMIFRSIGEIDDVRGLGLAMLGTCPRCGESFGCNYLWELTEVIDGRKTIPSKEG
jgi:hypothetical protein